MCASVFICFFIHRPIYWFVCLFVCLFLRIKGARLESARTFACGLFRGQRKKINFRNKNLKSHSKIIMNTLKYSFFSLIVVWWQITGNCFEKHLMKVFLFLISFDFVLCNQSVSICLTLSKCDGFFSVVFTKTYIIHFFVFLCSILFICILRCTLERFKYLNQKLTKVR